MTIDATTIGAAVKALRERAGLSQEQAGAAISISRQAWANYESGARQSVFRSDLQDRIAGAIGVARADLLREVDRQAGVMADHLDLEAQPSAHTLAVTSRVAMGRVGPEIRLTGDATELVDLSWLFNSARSVRVAGDEMAGYAEPGDLVIYDCNHWPTRGEGCLIEMIDGRAVLAEYVGAGQGVVRVQFRQPPEQAAFPMPEIRGVYQVRFRGR